MWDVSCYLIIHLRLLNKQTQAANDAPESNSQLLGQLLDVPLKFH